jgi:hypothetical protein
MPPTASSVAMRTVPAVGERRAVLTVDLDCKRCRGDGFIARTLHVGFGPSAHAVQVTEPCRCLLPVREERGHD